MGKFTTIPADTYKQLQMNAGIMVTGFNPEDGTYTKILAASTGGFSFASNPTYSDFGEDIDNVPANTYQLKRIDSYDPTGSGTFLTLTQDNAKEVIGAADVDAEDATHFIPRGELTDEDFLDDITIVGDYSDVTTGDDAGYLAVTILHALNTAGFQWTSAKNAKGQFAVEYHGHYDLSNIDKVPFELYVKAGEAETTTTTTTTP